MKFQGTDQYVATDDLKLAVNAALKLQRPLLVKGEPGTGKTMLAEQVSEALGMPLLQWHIKSTTKAQQGLYEYDAVSRLRDSQLGDEKVKDIHNYIVKGVLWQAFTAEQPVVLLIDEIDRADDESGTTQAVGGGAAARRHRAPPGQGHQRAHGRWQDAGGGDGAEPGHRRARGQAPVLGAGAWPGARVGKRELVDRARSGHARAHGGGALRQAGAHRCAAPAVCSGVGAFAVRPRRG